mmetsp:Transcript_26949/g.65441  ORF Transcript_26949/g.65441 Transcript_26949/m.65441 type:complete len:246 (+) Transcript_26949:316-1053(+)
MVSSGLHHKLHLAMSLLFQFQNRSDFFCKLLQLFIGNLSWGEKRFFQNAVNVLLIERISPTAMAVPRVLLNILLERNAIEFRHELFQNHVARFFSVDHFLDFNAESGQIFFFQCTRILQWLAKDIVDHSIVKLVAKVTRLPIVNEDALCLWMIRKIHHSLNVLIHQCSGVENILDLCGDFTKALFGNLAGSFLIRFQNGLQDVVTEVIPVGIIGNIPAFWETSLRYPGSFIQFGFPRNFVSHEAL